MENDKEIKGAGNSYTTLFRQYDPRVARWLTIDPKVTAFESPYLSMGDNPIMYNDPLGDTIILSYYHIKKIKLNTMMVKPIGKELIRYTMVRE